MFELEFMIFSQPVLNTNPVNPQLFVIVAMAKKNKHKNKLEMKEHHPGCTWNLLHLFHFHNRHHHVRRMLEQEHSKTGDKSFKRKGSGSRSSIKINEAPNVDLSIHDAPGVPHQVEQDNKASTIPDTSYGSTPGAFQTMGVSKLIKILGAEETSNKSFGGSPLTSVSLPTTHFDLIRDEEAGETALPDLAVDNASSTFSINLSQDIDNFPGYLLNFSPEYRDLNSQSERSYTTNFDIYSRHAQLDELEKQLLVKHALLQEKLDEAKEAILSRNYSEAKTLARDLFLNQSKHFLDALEVHNTNKELVPTLLQNPNVDLLKHGQEREQFGVETESTCSSSSFCVMDSSPIHRKDLKHRRTQSKLFSGHGEKADSPLETGSTNQKRKECATGKRTLLPSSITITKLAPGTPGNDAAPNLPLNSPKELKSRTETGRVVACSREIKRRLKYAIKEGRKEQKYISMDGILHKVPYDSKAIRKEAVDIIGVNTEHGKNGGYAGSDSCIITSNSGKEILKCIDVSSFILKRDEIYDTTPNTNPSADNEPAANKFGTDQSCPELFSQKYASEGNRKMESYGTEQENVENIDSRVYGYSKLNKGDDDNPNVNINESSHREMEILHTSTIAKTMNSDTNFTLECRSEKAISHLMEDGSSEMVCPYQEDSLIKSDKFFEQNLIIQERDASNEENLKDVSAKHEIQSIQLPIENDNLEKDDLAYVIGVLNASGLGGDGTPRKWHSTDQPIDPLLFNRVERSPSGGIVDGDLGTSNHQLLFDCINETVLQIDDRPFKQYPSFSSLAAFAPPMPKKDYILDEVWAEVSWHLESQSQLDQSVEYLVARDLTKSDTWTNIQMETKLIVSDLEALIINDLLDDILYTIVIYLLHKMVVYNTF